MSDKGIADLSFDRYARMVRRTLGVPVALVSVVEEHRQVFPGAEGLPDPYQESRETPLSHSFCQYVVEDDRPLVITDARVDARLHDNLAIPDLGVIAYAGWPLVDPDGRTIGSLCAIDSEPHPWTKSELDALADLAAACSAELAQRVLGQRARDQAAAAERAARRSRALLALSEGLAITRTPRDVSIAIERVARETLGCLRAGIWLRSLPDVAPLLRSARGTGPRPPVGNLTFVENERTEWDSASRHSVLPIDTTNPLGRALLAGEAVFHSSRAEQDAQHPHLASSAQIGEGRAFLPLAVAGRDYGTLVLVWDEVREFGHEDRATMTALASYTAQAVQRALLHQERVDVALVLQDALLTDLSHGEGLEVVARYRPASVREKVGGDWYDAMLLPDGATALVVGDVVGHDMAAAAVMGRLRSTLTAFAWAHPDESPAQVTTRLDAANEPLGLDGLGSLVLARIDADDGGRSDGHRRLTWASAGHLPPVLVLRDGTTEVLDDEQVNDCLIGVDPTRERRDRVADMPPGSTLLLYTDGLVERRGEDYCAGVDRLAAVAGSAISSPEVEDLDAFVDTVIGSLVGSRWEDDVAVLAVRFNAAE